jgi:ribosomal protein L12E/L44/L45/RPP1/RPP2
VPLCHCGQAKPSAGGGLSKKQAKGAQGEGEEEADEEEKVEEDEKVEGEGGL